MKDFMSSKNKLSDNDSPFQLKQTALLFLVFNRLETTIHVFEAIRKAKPKRLYIASDGPRSHIHDDQRKVNEVRNFVCSRIDWPCEVKKLFRNDNLGCGLNVKKSIDWFFQWEKEGVILEDDVVPDSSFFPFCEELLAKYRTDERIGMISGNNHYGVVPNSDSYLFAKSRGCWGWATWQRAWITMDYEMKWQSTQYRRSILSNMGYSDRSISVWENCIASILSGKVSAWDWQWYMSLSAQNQLCIIPAYNQVANIGFGDNATHTFGSVPNIYLQTKLLDFPLKHPTLVVPNERYDFLYEQARVPKSRNFLKSFIHRSVRIMAKCVSKKKLRKIG